MLRVERPCHEVHHGGLDSNSSALFLSQQPSARLSLSFVLTNRDLYAAHIAVHSSLTLHSLNDMYNLNYVLTPPLS